MEDLLNYFNENSVSFIVDVLLISLIFIVLLIASIKKSRSKVLILVPFVYLIVVAVSIVLNLKYLMLAGIFAAASFAFIASLNSSVDTKQHLRSNLLDKRISSKHVVTEEDKKRLINVLTETCSYFSERKIGAIITLEQDNNLNSYIDKAVKLDAEVTTELLRTIFFPNTPLHDGAVIIRGDRIMCATAFYTPSDKADIPNELGSRHRAAIGISEDSDAFTLVVSEETGQISTTISGTITRNLSKEDLELSLSQHIFVR